MHPLLSIIPHFHGFLHFFRYPFTSTLSLLLRSYHLKTHLLSSSSSSSLLRSIIDLKTLKQVHASVIVCSGFAEPVDFPSKLISFYSQFNDNQSAISVFNSVREPTTLLWNLIMKSHVDFGLPYEALYLYKKMRESGVKNDTFTLPIINGAVLSLKSHVILGEMIHCAAVILGFRFDVYFCNTMIKVYWKCPYTGYARKLFDEMPQRDLVSWTSMISSYIFEGNVSRAFELLNEMRMEIEPNCVTLIVLLRGCYSWDNLTQGRQLHSYVIKNGLLLDRFMQNSILKMYSTLGSVIEVENFFTEIIKRDVISWNTLISFYLLRGEVEEVVVGFNQMRGEVALSSETLTLVLSAFSKVGNLVQGEKLHCSSVKGGLFDDILLASFLDFYAKHGALTKAVQLFREIPSRSSNICNTMMLGYIQNGYYDEAISLFRQKQAAGIQLQPEILRSLVDACSHLGALQLGKEIHGYILRNLFYRTEEYNICLLTSVLNMYVKCGIISSARNCFDRILAKDNIAWTSMIEGYGVHGLAIEAVQLLHQMLVEGVIPNRVTFLSLLSACSHSGLIREGSEVFFSMKWIFGIEHDVDHYTCMVDLLGRSGKVKEALAIIIRMAVETDSRIWGALVAACRIHGEKEVGEFAAQRLLEAEPDNVGYYTLLSNIQASVGKWDEVEDVRKLMTEKELRKTPGWSYIEERGRNYCFVSGDRLHERAEEIYEILEHLREFI